MFADDVGLLPAHMFTRMLEQARRAPAQFADLAGDLFRVMARGGRVGFETVDWFNGGLFDDDTVLPLERSDIDAVLAASNLDWSEIDPSILGTLFERGLDPGKRAQLAAHYTDRDKIGPAHVKGIEINPYAAELARVSVWIGEIQWMRRNGFSEARDPILKPLDTSNAGTRSRAGLAGGRRLDREPTVSGRQAADHAPRRGCSRPMPAGRPRKPIWSATGSRRQAGQIAAGQALRAGLVATNLEELRRLVDAVGPPSRTISRPTARGEVGRRLQVDDVSRRRGPVRGAVERRPLSRNAAVVATSSSVDARPARARPSITAFLGPAASGAGEG